MDGPRPPPEEAAVLPRPVLISIRSGDVYHLPFYKHAQANSTRPGTQTRDDSPHDTDPRRGIPCSQPRQLSSACGGSSYQYSCPSTGFGFKQPRDTSAFCLPPAAATALQVAGPPRLTRHKARRSPHWVSTASFHGPLPGRTELAP